jgi:hypothetical protein
VLTRSTRWRWFLAADLEGRWVTTEGYVDIQVEDDIYRGILRTSPDADPLDSLEISTDDGEALTATMTSPGDDPMAYDLIGRAYMGESIDGEEVRSMILTDDSTVLGLALGPRSSK